MSDPESFANDIAAWASETQNWIGDATSNEAKLLFSRVVEYSPRQGIAPFSTGHFIHNWTVSNSPLYFEKAGTTTSSQKIAEINSFITDEYFFMNKKIYLTNATSYAGQVEQDGWVRTDAYAPVVKAFGNFGAPVTKAFAASM